MAQHVARDVSFPLHNALSLEFSHKCHQRDHNHLLIKEQLALCSYIWLPTFMWFTCIEQCDLIRHKIGRPVPTMPDILAFEKFCASILYYKLTFDLRNDDKCCWHSCSCPQANIFDSCPLGRSSFEDAGICFGSTCMRKFICLIVKLIFYSLQHFEENNQIIVEKITWPFPGRCLRYRSHGFEIEMARPEARFRF